MRILIETKDEDEFFQSMLHIACGGTLVIPSFRVKAEDLGLIYSVHSTEYVGMDESGGARSYITLRGLWWLHVAIKQNLWWKTKDNGKWISAKEYLKKYG